MCKLFLSFQATYVVMQYVYTPFKEFITTVSKRRPLNRRCYLYFLLVMYLIYILIIPYNEQRYLYMLKVKRQSSSMK